MVERNERSAAYIKVVLEGLYKNHAVYRSEMYDMYMDLLKSVTGVSTIRNLVPVSRLDIQWGPKKRYEK